MQHKKFTIIIFMNILLILFSSSAYSQEKWTSKITISGMPFSCTSAEDRAVPILISDRAIKLGGGAYAYRNSERGPAIMLSPKFMKSLPDLGAAFTFYHECAHVALPVGIGLGSPSQEENADCYAIRSMRKHGLIMNWKEFSSAVTAIANTRSSNSNSGHMPSDLRIKNAAKCANMPVYSRNTSFCNSVAKLLSSDESHIKKNDYSKILPGMNCEADDSTVTCERNTTNGARTLTIANKIKDSIVGCFRKTIKIRKDINEKAPWYEGKDGVIYDMVFNKSKLPSIFISADPAYENVTVQFQLLGDD